MNLITKIEHALKGTNDAKFPILVTHLLQMEGYNFISAPGTVTGKEKNKKGSPDSFFEYIDGYLFVEYTTKERVGNSRSFMDKLLSNIDHCFNEKATKIPKNKVRKIILACNENINTAEDLLLKTKIAEHNSETEFEVYSIQKLSFKLANHPFLLSNYLDIHTIKGSIYPLADFLEKTKKGLHPALTNPFIDRNKDLEKCVRLLSGSDKLLLTGGAGVGKSRLAVRILEKFAESGYVPIVIEASSPPIWEELKNVFSSGKKYVVLMDDANKGPGNFDYLLNLTTEAVPYELKIVITCRDYVKSSVENQLKLFDFNEYNIEPCKDEEIEKIIIAALPNLKYYYDIKKGIVALAKGNARMALMATASVKPGAKNNYLQNPVLLYETYFDGISKEAEILTNTTNLQALAIISFFGVTDRQNKDLAETLKQKFHIDWDNLWSSISELHNKELIDLYGEEVARISDQVLGTYAFYKCFIDKESSVINYGYWFETFLESSFYKLRQTLIDVNNTFTYPHVKIQIEPHLTYLENNIVDSNVRYKFFELFWLYRQIECLAYIKDWISDLEQVAKVSDYVLEYNPNDFQRPGEFFEFLVNFWNQPNEYFESSIRLTLDLIRKQPLRFLEVVKFITDYVSYRITDVHQDYERQLRFYETLDGFSNEVKYRELCNLILLSIGSSLLGWHYHEFSSAKGMTFTTYNFSLHRTENLEALRSKILLHFAENIDAIGAETNKYLEAIIHIRGGFDKSLYLLEIPIYEKIISKLNTNQFTHCKFVKELSIKIVNAKGKPPKNWRNFSDSEVIQLSNFLRPAWILDRSKSLEESNNERLENFENLIKNNDWNGILSFLISASNLNQQQLDRTFWDIDISITEIFVLIARKNKRDYLKALDLFFSGKINFVLTSNIVRIPLNEGIVTGKELIAIIDRYNVAGKDFWISAVLSCLPRNEVNQKMLERLLEIFTSANEKIHIQKMSDFMIFNEVFEKYKIAKKEIQGHNIITYLTSLLLETEIINKFNFGFHFFQDYSHYFDNKKNLLADVYWKVIEADSGFDYEGKELEAVLKINPKVIIKGIRNNKLKFGYNSVFNKMKVNALWNLDSYSDIIEEILQLMLSSNPYRFISEENVNTLFMNEQQSIEQSEKMKAFVLRMLNKYASDNAMVAVLINLVYDNFRGWFFEFFRKLLLLNKDTELLKEMSFSRIESWSGSRVPIIQSKINFLEQILNTIITLPNLLDYSEHIQHFEKRIIGKREEIEQELRRDFIENSFY